LTTVLHEDVALDEKLSTPPSPGREAMNQCAACRGQSTRYPSSLAANLPSRRELLRQLTGGFGLLGLAGLLADGGRGGADAGRAANALGARPPHDAPWAKRVIFLYMSGGPSHLDTFDRKPRLGRDDGKTFPFAIPKDIETSKALLPSPFKFRKFGQ